MSTNYTSTPRGTSCIFRVVIFPIFPRVADSSSWRLRLFSGSSHSRPRTTWNLFNLCVLTPVFTGSPDLPARTVSVAGSVAERHFPRNTSKLKRSQKTSVISVKSRERLAKIFLEGRIHRKRKSGRLEGHDEKDLRNVQNKPIKNKQLKVRLGRLFPNNSQYTLPNFKDRC